MRHEVLQDGLTSSHSQFKDYLERFPPFEYSAKNWGYHARMSHSKVKEQVQAFVQSENALSQSLWVLFADRYLRRIKQGCSIRASLLYTAAYFSLGECLLYFLANSVSRDTKDDDGQTALHWAARNGQVEAAELLLKHGLEVYGAGKERKTALHYAADQDDSQLIKLLVQYRANIEYTDIDGQTPLLTAVQNVKLELAQELVRLGASIKAIDSMRRSALHLSTKGGSRSIQITNFLLARGACSEICDVGNMMPLHYAIRKGSKDTAEASIQAGACVNAGIARKRWNRTTKAGRGVYEPSPGDQDAPGSKLVHGLTPLHWAALIGHSEMVRYLLSKGADRTSVARVATHRCTLPYAKISFGITEILGTHPNGGLKFSATWLGLEVKRLNYIEPRTGPLCPWFI
ncbi:Ankyrin repeat-containing domain [Penicillium roqueforti FM164]|uniref:Ankyrin repeat-containing domain n=1 Tax=Penicillium roqueforti (strain FM164) TaxID=1365484 RepID=W6QP87_PENRF|nr:Ankyrin repeat-containing domain [Penicillium roqueforti FM164]